MPYHLPQHRLPVTGPCDLVIFGGKIAAEPEPACGGTRGSHPCRPGRGGRRCHSV